MQLSHNNVIALDVGKKRIGVARASLIAGIAEPYKTIDFDDNSFDKIRIIANELEAELVIIGLPVSLSGEMNDQARFCQAFADELVKKTALKVIFQDETLSTSDAELIMKKDPKYNNFGVDAVAAAIILQDYLNKEQNGL